MKKKKFSFYFGRVKISVYDGKIYGKKIQNKLCLPITHSLKKRTNIK